jgi:hypothetical protein
MVKYKVKTVKSGVYNVMQTIITPGERTSAYDSEPGQVVELIIYTGSLADCHAAIKLIENGQLDLKEIEDKAQTFRQNVWYYCNLRGEECVVKYSHTAEDGTFVAKEAVYTTSLSITGNTDVYYANGITIDPNVVNNLQIAETWQIQNMLGLVAEQKGYIAKAKVKCLDDWKTETLAGKYSTYLIISDRLYISNEGDDDCCVYEKGVWTAILY